MNNKNNNFIRNDNIIHCSKEDSKTNKLKNKFIMAKEIEKIKKFLNQILINKNNK